ncbi:uncharacterized protein OCT59_002745 [Rhizophagus irregularis]|nr:hypothetical protein OCT59_002745 [Rhizophagus irregularis]
MGNTPSSTRSVPSTSSASSSQNKCGKCNKPYATNTFKWCRPCQVNYLKKGNLINCISGNKKIDDLIKKVITKASKPGDILFEWIPYDQFVDIKEIYKKDSTIIYSAIWKNGPLNYDYYNKKEWERESNKKVALKCFYNSQKNILDEFMNNREYTVDYFRAEIESLIMLYGISQNPTTKDYIMVLQDKYCKKCGKKYTDIVNEWCKLCQKVYFEKEFVGWTSGKDEIDEFIRKKRSEIKKASDKIIEWIPYDQFSDIKERKKDEIYSAIWMDGPLIYDENKYTRKQYEKVTLKYSKYFYERFLKEIEEYLTETGIVYGISQHPIELDYIMVVKNEYCTDCDNSYTLPQYKWCVPCQRNYFEESFASWTSGNENIDKFIQEMQSEIRHPDAIVFEWVPYNQFDDIKEIAKVILNEVKYYKSVFGISQDPDTKDYIVIHQDGYCNDFCYKCGKEYGSFADELPKGFFPSFIKNKLCIPCNLKTYSNQNSGNDLIDPLIKEMQSKISKLNDMAFEWIPYNELVIINELCKDDFTKLYLAKWTMGPLSCETYDKRYKDEKVILKCFIHSQTNFDEFIHEAQTSYSINYRSDLTIYGVSQNPSTNDLILVFKAGYHCETCGNKYTDEDLEHKWCKPCQISECEKSFTNWSKNEKIDNLIQEMRLKIDEYNDNMFEWIPYKFNNIKKIGEGVYSAIWKDGPLNYDYFTMKWARNSESDTKVALKYFCNPQNITDECLNEVRECSIDNFSYVYNTFQIYGISQNPVTKDYIMVLRDNFCKKCEKQEYTRNKNVKVALKCLNNSQIISDRFLNEVKAYPINDKGGTLTDWMKKNYENFDWRNRLTKLTRIILGLEEIHQKEMIHRDLHAGNILLEDVSFSDHDVYDPDNVYVSDMGLSGQVNDTDEINKTKIYGVLPYVAPEVLNEKPYTQASDIYSLGMIMYFIATGRPPFDGRKHDEDLANRIMSVDDFRPEINEQIVPKCYIDLMKRCWDSNADNRPSATEVKEMISVFYHSYTRHPEYKYLTEIEIEKEQSDEIKAQFELAELIREEYTYYSSTNNDNQNNHPDHDNDDNNNDDDNNDDDNNDDNNNDDNDVSDPSAFVQAIADEVVPNNNNVSDPLAIEQAIADEIVPYNIG